MPHLINANPTIARSGDTVARRAIRSAIGYAALASAALDLDGREDEAHLVDDALETLTKAFESAGSPIQTRRSS